MDELLADLLAEVLAVDGYSGKGSRVVLFTFSITATNDMWPFAHPFAL